MGNITYGSLIWFRIARFTNQGNLFSATQLDVLNQIASYQPITQNDLAVKVTESEGGISRMLTRLEKAGYILRKQEWKTKWITLTTSGEARIHEVFQEQLTFQPSIVNECLTKEEQKTLYKLMTKLQKNTENMLGC